MRVLLGSKPTSCLADDAAVQGFALSRPDWRKDPRFSRNGRSWPRAAAVKKPLGILKSVGTIHDGDALVAQSMEAEGGDPELLAQLGHEVASVSEGLPHG